MEHANVRMIQAGNRFGLPLEPLLPDRVTGELCRQDFDGDGSFQPGIAGAVDFPHATRAERCKDFVGPESGAWSQRHTGRDYTFGGLRLLPSALSRTYDELSGERRDKTFMNASRSPLVTKTMAAVDFDG
jgi:hypothetical protein